MKKISALILGAALCAGAQAAPLTLSDSFTNAQQATDINQTGMLDLFDASLGTLTGVTLKLYGDSFTTLTLTNNASEESEVYAASRTRLWFTSSLAALNSLIGGGTVSTANSATGYEIQLLPESGDLTLASGETQTLHNVSDSVTTTLDLSSLLSSFISPTAGNAFSISCASATRLLSNSTGGNLQANQVTTASCGADILYTYTANPTPPAVPEPASLALVGLGLVGVAASRRKSRQA